LSPIHDFLSETATRALPRILTQVCRDPGAPSYGSCDRNWWHYKIRDFSSIILQQAGYAIAVAADLRPPTSDLLPLAAASARFWSRRAIRHGAFEEYYPCEQGYPPLAFSTLAVAKLCHLGIVPLADIRPGLAVAARQLLTRFEAEAANQQIAGTAALAVIRSLDSSLVHETTFQKILTDTLALQHAEGWFPEYDGPDLGYLSVSIDCLWDILDHTRDARAKAAILSAAGFTAWFVLGPLAAAGMHNARNTDYFAPYGLVRLAIEDASPQTSAIVHRLFTRGNPGAFHPFDAVDDRYWCHYIGHSVLRAVQLLEKAGSAGQAPSRGWDLQSQSVAGTSCPQPPPTETPNHLNRIDGHRPPLQAPLPLLTDHCAPITSAKSQPGSGHALLASPAGAAALVSTRKGAIVTAIWPDGSTANDFGWLVQSSGKLFVSHWWSKDWTIGIDGRQASCEGWLVSHKEHLSTPWKHAILRIGSFLAGRRLIKLLKRLIIFKQPQHILRFSRSVSWEGETLVIRDTLTGVTADDRITRAPRASKRHVASADGFHPQDLEMSRGCERVEKIERSGREFRCESRYQGSEAGAQRSEVRGQRSEC
jgi:hypothetical protein